MGKLRRSAAPEASPGSLLEAGSVQPELQQYGNAFAAELVTSGLSRPDGDVATEGGEQEPQPAQSGDGLPVTLALTINAHQQPQTADLSPYPNFFGISEYRLRPAQVTVETSETGHVLNLGVDVITPWNVQDRGRTDVPSASSSVITRRNWASVANDLRPQGIGRPRRDDFWVRSISERHERFHGTDDYAWTQRSARGLIEGVLSSRTLPHHHSAEDVRPLVLDSLRAVAHGNDAYYGGHARGDGDVPGEHRAYGDGREAYQALYDGIVARARSEFIGGARED